MTETEAKKMVGRWFRYSTDGKTFRDGEVIRVTSSKDTGLILTMRDHEGESWTELADVVGHHVIMDVRRGRPYDPRRS